MNRRPPRQPGRRSRHPSKPASRRPSTRRYGRPNTCTPVSFHAVPSPSVPSGWLPQPGDIGTARAMTLGIARQRRDPVTARAERRCRRYAGLGSGPRAPGVSLRPDAVCSSCATDKPRQSLRNPYVEPQNLEQVPQVEDAGSAIDVDQNLVPILDHQLAPVLVRCSQLGLAGSSVPSRCHHLTETTGAPRDAAPATTGSAVILPPPQPEEAHCLPTGCRQRVPTRRPAMQAAGAILGPGPRLARRIEVRGAGSSRSSIGSPFVPEGEIGSRGSRTQDPPDGHLRITTPLSRLVGVSRTAESDGLGRCCLTFVPRALSTARSTCARFTLRAPGEPPAIKPDNWRRSASSNSTL